MSNLFFFILSAHHGHPVDLSTNFSTEHFQPGVSPFLVTDSFIIASVSIKQVPVYFLFSNSSPPKLHFDTCRPTFPLVFCRHPSHCVFFPTHKATTTKKETWNPILCSAAFKGQTSNQGLRAILIIFRRNSLESFRLGSQGLCSNR